MSGRLGGIIALSGLAAIGALACGSDADRESRPSPERAGQEPAHAEGARGTSGARPPPQDTLLTPSSEQRPPAPEKLTVALASAERCAGGSTRTHASLTEASAIRLAYGSRGGLAAWVEAGSLRVLPLDAEGSARGEVRAHPIAGSLRALGVTSASRGFMIAISTRGGATIVAVDPAGAMAAEPHRASRGYDQADAARLTRWDTYRVEDDLVLVEVAGIWFWLHRFALRDGQLERTELRRSTTATERETDVIEGTMAAASGDAIAVLLDAQLLTGIPRERHTILSLPGGSALVLHRTLPTTAIALEDDRLLLFQREPAGFVVRTAAEKVGDSWRERDEVTPLDDPERLPPPFDAQLDVGLGHASAASGAELTLVRRRASGASLGEPFTVGTLLGGGASRLASLAGWAWTGRAFMVAWVSRSEAGWELRTRAVTCR